VVTSDSRCNECSNIRGVYDEKVGWGFGSNSPWVESSPSFWYVLILAVTWFHQMGAAISRLACVLDFGT
jgi:hypothetical protein